MASPEFVTVLRDLLIDRYGEPVTINGLETWFAPQGVEFQLAVVFHNFQFLYAWRGSWRHLLTAHKIKYLTEAETSHADLNQVIDELIADALRGPAVPRGFEVVETWQEASHCLPLDSRVLTFELGARDLGSWREIVHSQSDPSDFRPREPHIFIRPIPSLD